MKAPITFTTTWTEYSEVTLPLRCPRCLASWHYIAYWVEGLSRFCVEEWALLLRDKVTK